VGLRYFKGLHSSLFLILKGLSPEELSTLTPERVPTTLAQAAGWVTPLEENESLPGMAK
jgi:hypothetical protein